MASRRTTSLLQIILQWTYEHFILQSHFFIYRFRASHLLQIVLIGDILALSITRSGHIWTYWFRKSGALVADYFARNTLALSITRSPTAHPHSQGYILCTTKSVCSDTGHPRSRRHKVGTYLDLLVSGQCTCFRYNAFFTYPMQGRGGHQKARRVRRAFVVMQEKTVSGGFYASTRFQ